MGYHAISLGMYNYQLRAFFAEEDVEVDWSLNGVPQASQLASIHELYPQQTTGTVQDMCSQFSYDKGYPVLHFAGDEPVCCKIAEGQYAIPFKDVVEDGQARRVFMCGAFPSVDIVSKSITGE
ncbi:MAG: hypothetical protein GJ680_07500 [Alteromonadaceae bacterium]|nr:hypothetical protein [Alteromonadaceae bacterium]